MLDHCAGTCRAKFITGTVQALLAKPGGGRQWLYSLRNVPYKEASEALCELPGIGPKVGMLSDIHCHHAHCAELTTAVVQCTALSAACSSGNGLPFIKQGLCHAMLYTLRYSSISLRIGENSLEVVVSHIYLKHNIRQLLPHPKSVDLNAAVSFIH